MKKHLPAILSISLLISIMLVSLPSPVIAQGDSVVRAVLFYSPTCPHCAKVIQEDLPPLFEQYDTQLQIVGVDITSADGLALYQAAIEQFKIPQERLGVPTMIIDTWVLVGSGEIPDQFPGLVAHYLSQGGIDWPDIPGLREGMAQPAPTDTPEISATTETPAPLDPTPELVTATVTEPKPLTPTPGILLPTEHDAPTWQENFARDFAGNTLSIIVLIGMLAVLVIAIIQLLSDEHSESRPKAWIFLLLCFIGFGVAGYLAYVEISNTSAVCGPVGDCNTVQQSKYARLFGILPIGVLGLAGYFMIFSAWLINRFGPEMLKHIAALVMLTMTISGALFSVYLTFLEPFVIGATCAWCLTSAVVMTALLYLSLSPGKQAFLALQEKR